VKGAALQDGEPLGDELRAAVDQAGFLGPVLHRPPRNVVVIGLVGLPQVGGVRIRNRSLCPHPMQSCTRVEAAGKRDADLLAGWKVLKNSTH